MSDQNQNSAESKSLSRRDALKAIAAATGAVTLANVPQKWETPLVEVGLLPVHAQSSTCTIQMDGIFSIGLCDQVNNGILLVFEGTLTNADVASAIGQVAASSDQWEFVSFDINPDNPRQFAVAICINFNVDFDTSVTIIATDVNDFSCSISFPFGDSTETGEAAPFDWK